MSERTEHTPGEWCAVRDGWNSWRIVSERDNGYEQEMYDVADVDDGYMCDPRGQTEANAHLIAAAPDLLAVCEALIQEADQYADDLLVWLLDYDNWEDVHPKILPAMRVAIAKAKGEGAP